MHIVNAQVVWVLRLIFQQRTIIHFFVFFINIILKDVSSGQLLSLKSTFGLSSSNSLPLQCCKIQIKYIITF